MLVACVRTFAGNRGMVLGLLKGFIGPERGDLHAGLRCALFRQNQVSEPPLVQPAVA